MYSSKISERDKEREWREALRESRTGKDIESETESPHGEGERHRGVCVL